MSPLRIFDDWAVYIVAHSPTCGTAAERAAARAVMQKWGAVRHAYTRIKSAELRKQQFEQAKRDAVEAARKRSSRKGSDARSASPKQWEKHVPWVLSEANRILEINPSLKRRPLAQRIHRLAVSKKKQIGETKIWQVIGDLFAHDRRS
jgi:hypothetical protein